MKATLFLFFFTVCNVIYGQFQSYNNISKITYSYNTFRIGVPDTDFKADHEIKIETKTAKGTPVFFRFFFKKVVSDTEKGFVKVKDNSNSFVVSSLIELSEYDRFVELLKDKSKVEIVLLKAIQADGIPINIQISTTKN